MRSLRKSRNSATRGYHDFSLISQGSSTIATLLIRFAIQYLQWPVTGCVLCPQYAEGLMLVRRSASLASRCVALETLEHQQRSIIIL